MMRPDQETEDGYPVEIDRPTGSFMVACVPRGTPLWLGDGGDLLGALVAFVLYLALGDRRGVVVGVRRRRQLFAFTRIVHYRWFPALAEAEVHARSIVDAVRSGELDEAPALTRRQRRSIRSGAHGT